MKYNLSKTLALAVMALAISSPAKAETTNFSDNLYVSGSLGLTSMRDADVTDPTVPFAGESDFDNTWNLSAALGKRFTNSIRGEVELGYRSADYDLDVAGVTVGGGDADVWTLMLNGYYDFNTNTKLKPYLGAGVGLARHDVDLTIAGISDDGDDTVFAYQIGAGVTYNVAEKWDVQAGYRFLGSSDPEFDTIKTEYGSHEFRVGFIRSF